MKTFRLLTALTLGTLLWGCAESGKKAEGPFYTDIESRAQLHDWFRYAPERPIVVSGHRGGMVTGYPENCIESFEKTLSMMPSFFEIDPRLTKDSVIVLMHDATIDRTTTGTGKVSDYTFEELQQFFLKATSRPIRFRRSKSASSGAGARPSSTSTSRTCRWR